MDALTIITTALALGAGAGAKAAVEQAVKDTYAALKSLVLGKFGSKGDTAKALESVEAKPDSEARKAVLKEALDEAGAARDQEVADKAAELLMLVEGRSPGATGGLVGQINAAGGTVVVAHHISGTNIKIS